MCGISGYIGSTPNASEKVTHGLKELEYRGYDSSGVAFFNDCGHIVTVKAEGRLENTQKKLEKYGTASYCAIGHTRWATHGEANEINAHPHGNGEIAVVHNGIIENYAELKEMLEDKGYTFVSQTDTEAAAMFIYDTVLSSENTAEGILSAAKQLHGSYALGILLKSRPDEMFAIRKDSPLLIGIGTGENYIASDITAFSDYTKDYIRLDDGELAVIRKDSVDVFNSEGRKIVKSICRAAYADHDGGKCGFPHYMLKEINEQSTAVFRTVSCRMNNCLPDFSPDGIDDGFLQSVSDIRIVACGTAMHAGLAGRSVFRRFTDIQCEVETAGEFRYEPPVMSKNTLVTVISQSGETADTLCALRLSKEKGLKVLAIVNSRESTIAREADKVIFTDAGPEKAVASTKAYSVQCAVMIMLAVKFALLRGVCTTEKATAVMNQLYESAPSAIEEIIKTNSEIIKTAARIIAERSDAFFIGRGKDAHIAAEGALKLKEISYINAQAYPAGELKHGTISLIEDGTPVVAVITDGGLAEKTESNIKEVRARGGCVISVCRKSDKMICSDSDFVIPLPETPDIAAVFSAACTLQLLAYETALFLGRDIDKPRNLAKSVTVE